MNINDAKWIEGFAKESLSDQFQTIAEDPSCLDILVAAALENVQQRAEIERLRGEVERLTRDRDRLAGYVRAARRLSRDAHTHLLEERPEETAHAIYRVIHALASAAKEGDDR